MKKKYKTIGLCMMLTLSTMTLMKDVHAEEVITDDGLYAFDRAREEIISYNPNSMADAPKEVIIPEQVVVSGKPYAVRSLGSGAFAYLNVTKVVVADSITGMNGAFDSCDDLAEIVLGKGITKLDGILGSYLPSLTTFTVPGTVKTLSKVMPFDGCDNLKEMIFEEGFESILTASLDSLGGMANLERIVLPSTITSIHANAFDKSPNLKEIVIAQNKDTSSLAASAPWGAANVPVDSITWTGGGGSTSVPKTASENVNVIFDSSNSIPDPDNTVDPQWAVKIPKTITFSDQFNVKTANADVTLESRNGGALPSGTSFVKVSVASTNAFALKDGSDSVAYEMIYDDANGINGTLTTSNGTGKVQIGALQEGKTNITASANVTGTATKVGMFKDTLTYTIEKVTP